MRAHDLRTILLIQAVEESDTKGELLSLVEREAATQELMHDVRDVEAAFAADALSPAGERLLALRAQKLLQSLRQRAPIIDRLLAATVGAGRRDGFLLLALLSGVVLAALDGHRFIDILGVSLIALLAWNLILYVLWIANWIRPRALSGAGLARLYARFMGSRAASVLRGSRSFNAPLAAALPRFATEWGLIARALVVQRAARLLHICAVLVALGLIVGLLVRALVLREVAGWASSALASGIVRLFLEILYAPAAAISGVALPATAEEVEALRITATAGGAAPLAWVYLIALTMALYIVVPRMLGAAAATVRLWRSAGNMAVPAEVVPYARRTLAAPQVVVAGDEV